MKVEVLQENLSKVLTWVGRFVASRSSVPVLSMVKLVAKKGGLVAVATNMETGIEVEIGARVEQEGEVVVPAKLIQEYVSLLPAGKVSLVHGKSGLEVKSKGHSAEIAVEGGDEFPDMPEFDGKKGAEMEAGDIERLVRLVGFSASVELTRPVLSAMLWEFSKAGKLKVVATDGYRLSLVDKVGLVGSLEGRVLVPSRVVGEVSRLVAEEGAEKVKVVVSGKQKTMAFVFGKVRVVTRLVEGEFPAYSRILPKESGVEVEVVKSALVEAVKAATIFSRENANIVVWKIDKGELKIVSQATKLGKQESKIEVEAVKGERGEIAFNGKFLLDFLANIGGEKVVFSMLETLQPGMFTSEDKNFVHVIMPVRTQEAGK